MNKSGAILITANGTRDGVKEAQVQAVDCLSQRQKLGLVPILERLDFSGRAWERNPSTRLSERLTFSSFDFSSGYLVAISVIALASLTESLFVPISKF